jgi:hypothetical protein
MHGDVCMLMDACSLTVNVLDRDYVKQILLVHARKVCLGRARFLYTCVQTYLHKMYKNELRQLSVLYSASSCGTYVNAKLHAHTLESMHAQVRIHACMYMRMRSVDFGQNFCFNVLISCA